MSDGPGDHHDGAAGAPRALGPGRLRLHPPAVPTPVHQVGWKQILGLSPVPLRSLAWARAARVVTGVVVPFAAGTLTGHLADGAFAALGALPAGFVSFQGARSSRLRAIALASLAMAVSTFAGGVLARSEPWGIVPVAALLGYSAGLLVSAGTRLTVVGIQAAVALEVSISVPMAPGPASVRAALVLAGGLFQGLLVVTGWVARPGAEELRALSATYADLASYATHVGSGAAPGPETFPATSYLRDPSPLMPASQRLAVADMVEEAERIRATLGALATSGSQGELEKFVGQVAQLLRSFSEVLSASVWRREPIWHRSLFRRRRNVSRRAQPRGGAKAGQLPEEAERIRAPEGYDWRWSAEALIGQLRAVSRMIGQFNSGPRRTARPRQGPAGRSAPVPATDISVAGTLRANISLDTEAGRHALRLGLLAGAAQALVIASGLAEGRWAVLTLMIVLKPDYTTTVLRSAQRAFGTAVGAAVGVALVQFGHLGPGALMISAGLAIGCAYAVFDSSYLIFSVFLTAFVVLLMDVLGTPAAPTALDRFANTLLGAGLALAAFALWPTWEGKGATHKFAGALDAHARYASSLLLALAGRPCCSNQELRELQTSARRARSDAEASAHRLALEPRQTGPWGPRSAEALAAAFRRLARNELSLHALVDFDRRRPRTGAGAARPLEPELADALAKLAVATEKALSSMAATTREGHPVPATDYLRRNHSEVVSAAGRDLSPEDEDGGVASAIVASTDGVVDAIGTVSSVLTGNFGNAR